MSATTQSLFARNVPGLREKLSKACVGIAGLGGLGSNAATALARAGIGKLILIDGDQVELSNLNRQHYFLSDVGRRKVDALTEHLQSVNPTIGIEGFPITLAPPDVPRYFGRAALLIEAFDRAEAKKWLIDAWCRAFPQRPIVCASGLSGYGRTADLKVTRAGNIWFCGDLASDLSEGLCAARVAIVANMQANVAIELLMDGGPR